MTLTMADGTRVSFFAATQGVDSSELAMADLAFGVRAVNGELEIQEMKNRANADVRVLFIGRGEW